MIAGAGIRPFAEQCAECSRVGTRVRPGDGPRSPGGLAGLDTDLAVLVDDPEALALVRRVLSEHDPGRAAAFHGALRYESGTALRHALLFAEPEGLDAVDSALEALATSRGEGDASPG